MTKKVLKFSNISRFGLLLSSPLFHGLLNLLKLHFIPEQQWSDLSMFPSTKEKMFPKVMAASQAINRRAGRHQNAVGKIGEKAGWIGGERSAGVYKESQEEMKRKDFTHDRASRPGVRNLQTLSIESIIVEHKSATG